MRLTAVRVIGVLTVTAVPLSAGAETAAADQQAAPNARQAAPATNVCGPGWYWEQAGYAKHGKWRPAHCAPEKCLIDGLGPNRRQQERQPTRSCRSKLLRLASRRCRYGS
jgi:hypothetical protein